MSRTLEWGTRVRPGKSGLKIGDLNVGIYGEIPDHWEEQTRMPRGAYPMPGVPPIGIALRSKRDLWADNAADLYEEAIQRRWVPATDIPWDTIEPLPDDVEAAMCQLWHRVEPGRERRVRDHRLLASAHVVRLPRGQAVPGDQHVRRGSAPRGVQKARTVERRWTRTRKSR